VFVFSPPAESDLRSWAPVFALIILSVGFGLAEPKFVSLANLLTIADRSAIPLILSVGMTFVVLQGSIDLSIEGVMATGSLVFAMSVLNSRTELDLGPFGLLAAALAGACLGFVNGTAITWFRVPSFLVTLGIWSVGAGIAMLLSGDQPPLIRDPLLSAMGLGRSLGVPNLFLLSGIVLLIGYVLQNFTRFGRYSLIIGGGEHLARLHGLPVDRYKVLAFTFAGLLSGLAGALESARVGLGHVDIGSGQMLATITAVLVGGTSLNGGRGGVLQSAVGVFTLAVVTNGMIFVGISPYAQQAVYGVLILMAALVTAYSLRASPGIVK